MCVLHHIFTRVAARASNCTTMYGGGANYAGQFGRRAGERARVEVARANFGAFSKLSQSYGGGERGQQGAERRGKEGRRDGASLSHTL